MGSTGLMPYIPTPIIPCNIWSTISKQRTDNVLCIAILYRCCEDIMKNHFPHQSGESYSSLICPANALAITDPVG